MHELASSLSTAFLLMLERLTPKERAAYLLYEIFDMDYTQVAAAVGVQEAACRKLVSRAKASLGKGQVRYQPEAARQDQLLSAFHSAIASGSTASLTAMLAEDVELCADSGGKASAIRETLSGVASVLEFIGQSLHMYWQVCEWLPTEINGTQGVIIKADGGITASMTFGFDGAGRASWIFIMRNPDKLAGLDASLHVQLERPQPSTITPQKRRSPLKCATFILLKRVIVNDLRWQASSYRGLVCEMNRWPHAVNNAGAGLPAKDSNAPRLSC